MALIVIPVAGVATFLASAIGGVVVKIRKSTKSWIKVHTFLLSFKPTSHQMGYK